MTSPSELTQELLDRAQDVLGHRFADVGLLSRALTHPSYGEVRSARSDYERLEFLGDAVLGFIVAEEIYQRFPELSEGFMTKLKASLVSHTALVRAATELGLEEFVVLGPAHADDEGRALPSALEDAFEAIVGAVYLDDGLEAARGLVDRTLGPRMMVSEFDAVAIEHPKSRLQEMVQARGTVPIYRITASDGPAHARRFTAEVLVDGRAMGSGSGVTKREAEMRAAEQALDSLREHH